jgi:uncharacterized membrane protein YeaQ/YmgE (transglycosylase-associated protein family)
MSFVIWIIVGGIGGWLAGLLVKGGGFGLIGNVLLGIVGAAVAGYVLPLVGLMLFSGLIGAIINAAIGAGLVLVAIRVIKSI